MEGLGKCVNLNGIDRISEKYIKLYNYVTFFQNLIRKQINIRDEMYLKNVKGCQM